MKVRCKDVNPKYTFHCRHFVAHRFYGGDVTGSCQAKTIGGGRPAVVVATKDRACPFYAPFEAPAAEAPEPEKKPAKKKK